MENERKKNILNDVKQKFSEVRDKCPGMSDDVYALTDYISLVANDSLIPLGLSMCLSLIMDSLLKGRNEFKQNEPLPEYLNRRRDQIVAQMAYIPQVVDAIADEKFAEEFREIYRDIFGFNPPKRVNANIDFQCPENVRAAVDWWANAIQSPKFDDGCTHPLLMTTLYVNRGGYSKEDIKVFKRSLAQDILIELQQYGRCLLSVDYHPCEILSRAGEKIGLNDTPSYYPWKTRMIISENAVEVSEGYGSPKKTVWSSEEKKRSKRLEK